MKAGDRIKKAREAVGITQKELAYRLNVTPQNINQYETGKRNPKQSTLSKIADALNVPLIFLIDTDSIIEKTFGIKLEEEDRSPEELEAVRQRRQQRDTAVLKELDALNEQGIIKVIEYARDLRENPKYQKEGEINGRDTKTK